MKYSQHRYIGRQTLAAIALLFTLFAQPAWAYLDPGTGSMIISAIVGLFATLGLALKTYWYKIKAFLRRDSVEAPVGDKPQADAESSADH